MEDILKLIFLIGVFKDMTQKTLAVAFLDQLKAWGVKFIFGVTGDDVLPFLSALDKDEHIKFVATSNEAGAAFMASYYAKLTGELGVCVASAPGSINLLEGIADAFLDGAPVLALTGQVQTAKLGIKTKQYYHQQEVYSNFVSYTESVVDPQHGIRLLITAMSKALLTKTVCHLSVYENHWSKQVEAEPGTLPLLVKGVKQGKQAIGDVVRVVQLMQQARKPVVVFSKKAIKVIKEVKRLVKTWGAAVITTQEAKGLVPYAYPSLLGGVGEAWIPTLLAQSDCVILIGSASYEEKFLPKCPIIQLEEEPCQINDRYLWDSLAGDLDYIIEILNDNLKDYQVNTGWLELIRSEREARNKIIETDLNNKSRPIYPGFLMATLSEVVHPNAIITLDEGSFMHWFDRNFKAQNQEVLTSSYWRSMGLAVPAAISAQLTDVNRQVLALVGDGCILMNLGEFTTAIKYKLPITVIVIRDHLYSLERDKTQIKGLRPEGLLIAPVEYSLYAKACGAQGFKVEDPHQLRPILEKALALNEPVIVDVVCESIKLPQIGRGN